LATVFFERLFKTANKNGIVTTVIPQNWLFLTTYKKYRENLLLNKSWNMVTRLGAGAFSQISGEVVKAILISISNSKSTKTHNLIGLDVSESPNAVAKDEASKITELQTVNQEEQLSNPDFVIQFNSSSKLPLLSEYADALSGVSTGELNRFTRRFWEVKIFNEKWELIQSSDNNPGIFGGLSNIIFWEKEKGELYNLAQSVKHLNHAAQNWLRGKPNWGKKGVVINKMSELSANFYSGEIYDENCCAIIPHNIQHLNALMAYCISNEYSENVRKINQSLLVQTKYLLKVPFDIEHWQKVAEEKYPNGLPKPYSNDPTQWLFHGHPIKTDNSLQVAIARLLGYRWPAESDTEMELAEEARKLIEQVQAFDHLSDEDGIFCIPSVNAEQAGADRLRTYLQSVFADSWGNNTINDLLEKEGASSSNLEEWLRKEFFVQHCKVFQNRPFIWHIWDGRNDGFAAMVNYHKLDKENLSKLIYTYLGDWIRMCEAKKKNDESGAEGLLSAALKLKEKLEAILHGEAPFDIFVRWKPLEQQPIGWEPDLNDGVRLNIRPFVEAGVLRNKFNVKWGVDRGKNPPGSPWGEIRDNDKHLTLAEKREARENKK